MKRVGKKIEKNWKKLKKLKKSQNKFGKSSLTILLNSFDQQLIDKKLLKCRKKVLKMLE